MIIIKIKGGLGNQLFQYALGRSIEINTNEPVKFDLSWFKKFSQRKYQLNNFNTKIKKASFFDILGIKSFEKKYGRKYLIFNIFKRKNSKHIKDTGFSFDKEILNSKKNTYLDGNWQSEKYFKDINKIIHKELTLYKKPNKDFKKLEKTINETNSISIHIRRGDYTTAKIQKVLKLCTIKYYNKAIKIIKNKVKSPTFFIFSDDIEWAKKNIQTNCSTIFVSNNKLKDYEELILMSKCNHNIIPNSTFSWWSAWLNQNPNKIVIAPIDWFNNKTKKTKDIIPENWIRSRA